MGGESQCRFSIANYDIIKCFAFEEREKSSINKT